MHAPRRRSDGRHSPRLQGALLTRALHDVAVRYDALFQFECPYLMVIQEAPRSQEDWHLAFEFFPFHRSRTAMKIRASIETATGLFINDILPEGTAHALAELDVSTLPMDETCLFVARPAEPWIPTASVNGQMGA
jgi:galactose-1-phosphate uridylyltransferase